MKRQTKQRLVGVFLLILVVGAFLFFWFSREATPKAAAIPPAQTGLDLSDMQEAGELLAVTINSPTTYYEYRGKQTGLAYNLAERFAVTEGVRLRMEVVRDTTELVRMLKEEEVDLIAFPLPVALIKKEKLAVAGWKNDSLQLGWAARVSSPLLIEALNKWYNPARDKEALTSEKKATTSIGVKRKVYSPYLNRAMGQISIYDSYFQEAAQVVRWDWRLIAAQCYQESAFDPQAVSYAGACGLMQIMPTTADHLGLARANIYNPKENVAAAAKYLKELDGKFSEIKAHEERIKFVLAAYNGGYYHLRDAMALAQKQGRNPLSWHDVSQQVLNLARPEYYRDPVVKYGYMIGSQTYDYVESILLRWGDYRGAAVGMPASSYRTPERATHKNRFTEQRTIATKEQIAGKFTEKDNEEVHVE